MVKLIASDLDGTLLTEDGNVPDGFDRVLQKITSGNAVFAVSSGRSYNALEHLFKPYFDRIRLICDNGAYVAGKDRIITSVINKETVEEILRMMEDIPGAVSVLCGQNGTFVCTDNEFFFSEFNKCYKHYDIVDNIYNYTDGVFKIAIFDSYNPLENVYPKLNERFGGKLSCLVSGQNWVDVMNKGIDKGMGLKLLMDELGVKSSETAAFGDYYNDIAMFGYADYSFAMKKSDEDVKKHSRFVAENVLDEINKLLDGDYDEVHCCIQSKGGERR